MNTQKIMDRNVSEFAKSLPGSPEKGKLVSQVAHTNVGQTNNELEDNDNIDETTNDEVNEGTEEPEKPAAEDEQAGEDSVEEPEAPVTEDDQAEEFETEEQETPVTEDDRTEEGALEEPESTVTAENDSITWVNESYQFIDNSYQSVIYFYQVHIEQYLNSVDANQTSEESENVPVIGEVSDDSVKADETEPTTLEEDAFQDNSVENTNLPTETDENL